MNKSAFLNLQKQFDSTPAGNDGLLLCAISVLTALVDNAPTLQDGAATDFKRWLDGQSRRMGATDATKIFNAIKAGFGSLYDFPLTIPEVKTLNIAGRLTIVSSGTKISAKDFLAYALSAECVYGSQDSPLVLSYRFDGQTTVTAGAASFSLTATAPVYRNDLLDPVTVGVKGIDGSLIWSKEFSPDDPLLAKLDISVPLQGSVTLAPPPSDAEKDRNKKLRGRVLVFNKDCVLKDVLVLVQAKASKNTSWRAVGAGTTDGSGNFSIPYPYGIYVEARALVSLAPKEAASISIVPNNGDETISDDFLYLLLSDPICPPPKAGEDCDCLAPGQTNRLPDYADLIGSDTYSQDIGGSCVNLSKPNRTISEFNYKAIVRISDPDVANYLLNKIELGLDSIDVSLAITLSSNASALASALSVAVANANKNRAENPTATNSYIADALSAAAPRVAAAKQALTQPASAITATVLAAVENHIDAFVSILEANKALVGNNELKFSQEEEKLISAAGGLKNLVNIAIDTVGTSARYELIGGKSKTIRRSIDLDNPVDWQDAPECQTIQPLAKFGFADGPGARLKPIVGLKSPVAGPDKSDSNQTATLSQAVTVATGHILHYKALFKADGYSMGDLIYSLPLAPGQKKEIVVFDASHTLVGAESQSLNQNERLAMGLVDERDITNQLAGSLLESLRGSSNANTSGVSAGFGTGGQGSGGTGAYGGSGSAVLGIAGGVAKANSTASQDSSRDVSQFFGEKLRQSVMQNAEGYRQLNASVVTTVQEGQRYGVTSEVVANHNHCHALTMMYFEVLRHYAIFQELSSVEECLFVPFLLTRFTTENVAKWRDILAPALLPMPSDTYLQPFSVMAGSGRQHPLIKAFDADQRIKTHYANVDYPAGAYDDEPIRFLKGEMLLRVELPRPKSRYDRIKSLPVTTKTVTSQEIDLRRLPNKPGSTQPPPDSAEDLARFLPVHRGPNIQYNTKEVQVQVKQAIFDAFMTLDANYDSVPPAQCIRVVNFTPPSISFGGVTVPVSGLDFFQDGIADRDLWTNYARLLGYSDVFKMLNYYFKGRLIAEWDDIFYNDIAPFVFRKIVDSIRISEIKADFTSEIKYTGGERLISLYLSGTTSKKRNKLPSQLRLWVSSADVMALGDSVTLNVENMRITYSTAHYNGLLYGGNVNNDLLDDAELDIPENSDEKRNPRREDRYLAAKLIEHLNSNLEYYNKVLWYRLDPDRRFMLLDGFSIQIFNDDGTPVLGLEGLRSLASVVKNELITVAGNSLVFPVAPGYRVSGSYIKAATRRGEEPVTLFDHYKPLTPIQPYRVSVPSKGVFAEAVQGVCNACEKIETDRLQDWSRFPNTDEPTPISPVPPVPTPGHGLEGGIQRLRHADGQYSERTCRPAPGAGLARAVRAARQERRVQGHHRAGRQPAKCHSHVPVESGERQGICRDGQGDGHAEPQHGQNSGKIMDSLNAAKSTGALEPERITASSSRIICSSRSTGEKRKRPSTQQKQSTPTPLTKAAVDAASLGRNVTAETSDSEGNAESVEISNSKDDATTGPIIVAVNITPALRCFGPGGDFTGKTKLSVQGKNLPSGARLQWSIPAAEIGQVHHYPTHHFEWHLRKWRLPVCSRESGNPR